MIKQIIKLPVIVFDIDGVLLHGNQYIKQGLEVMKQIKRPLKEINEKKFVDQNAKIPFILLTNGGGGIPERMKLQEINQIFGFKENDEKIQLQQLIVNFTPLKQIIVNEFQNKLILLAGLGQQNLIMEDLGQSIYITQEEYFQIYPFIVPYSQRKRCEATVEKVSQRLGISKEDLLKKPLQIHGIFILYDPYSWEELIQLITDLLTTENGNIAERNQDILNLEKHIPIYCVNDDVVYKGVFQLPRVGNGMFNAVLKNTYKLLYGKDIQINMYGKPYRVTFEYAESIGKQLMKLNNNEEIEYEVSNFYMIGDNPDADIRGGNQIGWTTILVKTGVYQGGDISNQPNYLCDDVSQAFQYILQKENII